MQIRGRFVRSSSIGLSLIVALATTVGCTGGSSDATSTPNSGAATQSDAEVALSVDGGVVATVDSRFQSYNIEMVEVTGGQFWKPYDAGAGKLERPPLDLSSRRLRNLARALGPAYVRVSGSWANATFFDPEGSAGDTPPSGFDGVLTGDQWRAVGMFADAVDAKVMTSFASNDAVRGPDGAWLDEQARSLLEFTKDNDIPLAAVEMFNEPNLVTSMPAGYNADRYAQDFATFTAMVDDLLPKLRIVGPSTTNEVAPTLVPPSMRSADMLKATASNIDAFSYHSYPMVSERCGSAEGPEIALTQEFLSRIERDRDYYEDLRDRYIPGAPMWVTETAQAACGGDRWASTSLDMIRYIDTLGRLAHGNGDIVFHNTLAASDYGLIDEDGLVPRPDYWAAVLWHRLMGPQVLRTDTSDVPDLAVYAHCTPDVDKPSVTYAVVNSSATESRTVTTTTGETSVYQLTSDPADPAALRLNGTQLEVAADGSLPQLRPQKAEGAATVPAASVAFVVERTNAACARHE